MAASPGAAWSKEDIDHMMRLASITGVAILALVLGVGSLGIASAQDGTTTPAAGATTTPGDEEEEDDPLDTGEEDATGEDDPLDAGADSADDEADDSSGTGGAAPIAPSTGTGDALGGSGGGGGTAALITAAAAALIGAGALYLGARRTA
jgi:hypothetical protein